MAAYFDSFTRWVALKKYQIEVTFCVYIFTPGEKALFWSTVFLLTALTFIATILYMPQHINFIMNRAYFYLLGQRVDVLEVTKEAVQEFVAGAAQATTPTLGEALGKETVAAVVEGAREVVREL